MNEYESYYSESSFWSKLQALSGNGWCTLLKQALTLYVLLKVPTTPLALKVVVVGVLGYFIAPIDALPDLIPLVGYSDDMSLIGLTLQQLSSSITPSVEQEAEALMPDACR